MALDEYSQELMKNAIYVTLTAAGATRGTVPPFDTVEVVGSTLSECRQALRSKLDEQIMTHLMRGIRLPAVSGADMNSLEDLTELSRTAKLEAMAFLAREVANQMNNILMAISASCELSHLRLQRTEVSDPGITEGIKGILKGVEKGAELTRQLQAFAAAGERLPGIINLGAFVAEFLDVVRNSLSQRIHITVVANQPSLVRIDPGQLEVAIKNLILNARDGVMEGGQIHVEIECVEVSSGSSLHGKGIKPGKYSLLSIADDGCGMRDEVEVRAFDPFFTTERQGVHGLGMSVVYGIIKQNGGCIQVQSKPGEGTMFRVFLPRIDEGSPAAA